MGCCKSKDLPQTKCDMCFKSFDQRYMMFYPFKYAQYNYLMCKHCLDKTVEDVIIDLFERENKRHKIEEREDTPYPPTREPSVHDS